MVIGSNGFGQSRRPQAAPKKPTGPAAWTEPANALPEGIVLDILDRVHREGETYEQAGAAHGLSRSAVAGLVKRVIDACAAEDARPLLPGERPVAKSENCDGAMGARWWKPGLARQQQLRRQQGGFK